MYKKYIFLFLVSVYTYPLFSQEVTNDKEQISEAYLAYKMYNKYNPEDFHEIFSLLENLDKNFDSIIQKRKNDTTSVSKKEIKEGLLAIKAKYFKRQEDNPMLKAIDESIKAIDNKNNEDNIEDLVKKSKVNYKYYFFKDTVRTDQGVHIGDRILKTVFIPDEFKKYRELTHSGKTHRDVLSYENLSKQKNVVYSITMDKSDTKNILNFKGYKVKIIEKTNMGSEFEQEMVYECYISEAYQYPIGYYEFFELKKDIKFQGLVLECKVYEMNYPKSYSILQLSEFNTEKQDRSLIKIDVEKYKKI